jgi:hypothetical protein
MRRALSNAYHRPVASRGREARRDHCSGPQGDRPATVPVTAEVVPSSAPVAPEERPDPRRVALHREVRAAIINPSIFALTLLVFRDLQVATFAK